MCVISAQAPGNIGLSVSEIPVGIPTPEKSSGERTGDRKSTNKADAVEKCIGPISETPETKCGCVQN